MKSLRGNIFEQIASVENIVAAIHSAAKGKRHKRAVRYAEAHAEEVATRLHEELIAGTWTPPVVHVGREINDGLKAKKRIIVCPEFVREQVVHHALLKILAPYIQRRSFRWSCGSMPGRGQEEMAKHVSKAVAGKKLTAYDAQKMTSYSARFKAFGCYRAFVAEVLHNGKLTMSDMASIISRHDRAKAKARQGDVHES